MGGRQLLYELFFSKRPSVQASKRPSVQASKRPSVQASKRPSGKANTALITFFLLLFSPAVMGAILCSSFRPKGNCRPPCNGSCTYYTFKGSSISRIIDHMPFDLSVFNPGGNYCDLEAEDQLSTPMKEIPFTLGSHDIRVLPYSAELKYQIWKRHTKRGRPCPKKK